MYMFWCLNLLSSSGFHSSTLVPNTLFSRMIPLNPTFRCLARYLKMLLVVSLFFFGLLLIVFLFFFFLFLFLPQFYIRLIYKHIGIFLFLFGLKQATFIKFYIDVFHYPFKSEVVTYLCYTITWVSNKYAFIHRGVKFFTFVVFPFYVAFASKNSKVLDICCSSFP